MFMSNAYLKEIEKKLGIMIKDINSNHPLQNDDLQEQVHNVNQFATNVPQEQLMGKWEEKMT